jgi:hypothetical protein
MSNHLSPENCYICGYSKENHTENAGHKFWSNAEAEKELAKEPQGNTNVEARYIKQYRPY